MSFYTGMFDADFTLNYPVNPGTWSVRVDAFVSNILRMLFSIMIVLPHLEIEINTQLKI